MNNDCEWHLICRPFPSELKSNRVCAAELRKLSSNKKLRCDNIGHLDQSISSHHIQDTRSTDIALDTMRVLRVLTPKQIAKRAHFGQCSKRRVGTFFGSVVHVRMQLRTEVGLPPKLSQELIDKEVPWVTHAGRGPTLLVRRPHRRQGTRISVRGARAFWRCSNNTRHTDGMMDVGSQLALWTKSSTNTQKISFGIRYTWMCSKERSIQWKGMEANQVQECRREISTINAASGTRTSGNECGSVPWPFRKDTVGNCTRKKSHPAWPKVTLLLRQVDQIRLRSLRQFSSSRPKCRPCIPNLR